MTNHVARLYAIAFALLVFFLSWAVVASRPWGAEASATAQDPRVAALDRRAAKLERERVRVQRMLDRRFVAYRRELAVRQAEIAAAKAAPVVSAPSVSAPPVSVVSAPPVTSTRSS